ncbi:MAG: hypothetical protein FWC23_10600 [Chitinispirillia bacterium]|nr:hypothetical protein [Chitinispirillia bacterium]
MSDETNIPDNPGDADGPDANREFKDGMFRAIFRDPKEFLRVASFVLKTDFGPDTPMEEVTLSSPLYMGRKNDVSFLVDGRLIVFTEHQSTVSPNIPLRFLIYAADTYKARFSVKDLHRSRRLMIPRPYFFVFYNGNKNVPPVETIRLSDMFTDWPCPKNPSFSLDLEITVYNINISSAPEILHKCGTLAQYETFVELVRGYENELAFRYEKPLNRQEKDLVLKQAVKLATAECLKRGILADFLNTHAKEIVYMMTGPITVEDMKEYWQEEAREEGMAKGIVQTAKAMKTEGFDPETIAKITGLTIDDIRRL